MKLLIAFAVLCVVACAAQTHNFGGGHSIGTPRPPSPFNRRFRREPQGSVVLEGKQSGGGPDSQPSLDVNYKQRIIDNDQTKLDAFGGANLHGVHMTHQAGLELERTFNNDRTKVDAFGSAILQRGHLTPQVGLGVEHNINNELFLRGQSQLQPRPGGGFEPSFGVGMEWRMRREAGPYEEAEAVEEIEPCSAC